MILKESVNYNELEGDIQDYCEDLLFDMDVYIDEIWLHGSRIRGNAREDSDLDAVMFYYGTEREDNLFNILHEESFTLDGVEVDINPVNIRREADKEAYKKRSQDYDKEVMSEDLTEAKHDELNPKLWENDELRPEVKEKLELIVNKFLNTLKEDKVDLDVKDVLLLGSNANYNYTEHSDLDLHIIADLSQFKGKEKELAMKVYDCQRRLFNNKYDPELRGIEVEIYVEPYEDDATEVVTEQLFTLTEAANSNGVYSLYSGWIKQPVKDNIPDNIELEPELSELISKANDTLNKDSIDDIDKFVDDIYILRQTGLITGGEYSKENQLFKEVRNQGILDKMREKRVELENKDMSLEEATIMNDSLRLVKDFINESKKYPEWFEVIKDYLDGDLIEDSFGLLSDQEYLASELEYLSEDSDISNLAKLFISVVDMLQSEIDESLNKINSRDERAAAHYNKLRELKGLDESEELDEDLLNRTSLDCNYDINRLRKLLGGNKD